MGDMEAGQATVTLMMDVSSLPVLPHSETRSIFDVLLHNQGTEDDTTLEFHQELLR